MIHLLSSTRGLVLGLLFWSIQQSDRQSFSAAVASPNPANSQADSLPLPDIARLMQQVEANQKTAEAIIRNYIYTSTITSQDLDGRGNLKKSETIEREVFYIGETRLERTTRKDGKDLTPEEQKKEVDRIDKAIAKAKQSQNEPTAPSRHDTVTFARFLELGSFSNERRLLLHGRSTIALDYTGDAKAKTHNALEGVIHDMAGTVWIDEQDSALARVEGRFLNSFKVAGGLVFSVAKDTAFTADLSRINNEVWLPSTFTANGSLRALLFFSFNGRVSGSTRNYRRFKANATILPGTQEVDPPADPAAPATPHR